MEVTAVPEVKASQRQRYHASSLTSMLPEIAAVRDKTVFQFPPPLVDLSRMSVAENVPESE
jgi:hypothetical protein